MTALSRHSRTDAGGVAAQGGANYQARAAAWLGVRMLAGAGAHYGLGSDVRWQSVRCQAASPIDDIVASTSEEGLVFIQAKRRVSSVRDQEGSEFDEVVAQFVRQLLAMENGDGSADWQRPSIPIETASSSSQAPKAVQSSHTLPAGFSTASVALRGPQT